MGQIGYKEAEGKTYKDQKERIKHLHQLLDRPIRVCGMVKNEGEPGGGPFWVKMKDGSSRPMVPVIGFIRQMVETYRQKGINLYIGFPQFPDKLLGQAP